MSDDIEFINNNERLFLDFLDYLFPYLEAEDLVKILEKYRRWLDAKHS